MLGQDPARRFDYLFEPLDGGDTAEDADDVGDKADPQPNPEGPRSIRPSNGVLAVVGVATVGAAVAFVTMPPPSGSVEHVDAPIVSVPPSTTTVLNTTTSPVPVPPPAATTPVVEAPITKATTEAQLPQPSALPSESSKPPDPPATHSPTTRTPISVAPAPRSPFPDQAPPLGGGGQHGGLLGGGGLL